MKIFDKIGDTFFGTRKEEKDALAEERRDLNIILFNAYKDAPEKVKSCFINMKFGEEQYKSKIEREIKETAEGLRDEEIADIIQVMTSTDIPIEEIKEIFLTKGQIKSYDNYLELIRMNFKRLVDTVGKNNSFDLVASDEKFARMIKVNDEAVETSWAKFLKYGGKIKEINDRISKNEDDELKSALIVERQRRFKYYDEAKEVLAEKLIRKYVLDLFKERFMSKAVAVNKSVKR